jgi:hypothetical protein
MGIKRTNPFTFGERVVYEKVAATYFPAFYCSIIGAKGLNFSVRDGKRWTPSLKPPSMSYGAWDGRKRCIGQLKNVSCVWLGLAADSTRRGKATGN